MLHKVNFERSLTDMNSEFSFSMVSCYASVKEPYWPFYLIIALGRFVGFIIFPRILAQCEMQTFLSRI